MTQDLPRSRRAPARWAAAGLPGTSTAPTAIGSGLVNTPITTNARARGAATDPKVRERFVALYRKRNYGPDRVARNILKAVERNRAVAPVAAEAWIAYAMKRISPRLAGWTARRVADAAD